MGHDARGMTSYQYQRDEPVAENSASFQAAGRLGAEMEAALLRELVRLHRDLDASFFKRQLAAPVVQLSDARGFQGRWLSATRTLELSRELVVQGPWGEVVEVMKHEMAHQFVDEVLRKRDETAHGPAFRQVCERLGIDARATAPSPAAGGMAEREERVLQRVAKLLALAESANEHEAQAAMSAAQRLMLKYNLDEIAARASGAGAYGFRHLGQPSGRVSESEHILGGILAEHFFVEVIWVPVYRAEEGKKGSVLEACGTAANLEMAAYVHSFLTHTAEQLWTQHKSERGIRGNRDRRTFLAGVMSGFRDKLRKERDAQKVDGLVWVGDSDLTGYYRKRHPYIRHARIMGNAKTDAHEHGRNAGANIVLRRPMGSGPEGEVRMLPARGGGG